MAPDSGAWEEEGEAACIKPEVSRIRAPVDLGGGFIYQSNNLFN
jgi:hypothetical protein